VIEELRDAGWENSFPRAQPWFLPPIGFLACVACIVEVKSKATRSSFPTYYALDCGTPVNEIGSGLSLKEGTFFDQHSIEK
jgi:hypothetical protein